MAPACCAVIVAIDRVQSEDQEKREEQQIIPPPLRRRSIGRPQKTPPQQHQSHGRGKADRVPLHAWPRCPGSSCRNSLVLRSLENAVPVLPRLARWWYTPCPHAARFSRRMARICTDALVACVCFLFSDRSGDNRRASVRGIPRATRRSLPCFPSGQFATSY